jgi:acetyl esterase/lipase
MTRFLLFSSALAWLLCPAGSASAAELHKQTHVYKQVGDTKIKADVYRPADKKKRPVLVWIHGGALITGSREGVSGRLRRLAADEGYVLVSIDYRLAPQVKIKEIISDLRDALQWIREKGPELFGADTSRLVVSGGSAGGYLTMMAGTLEPRPKALVTYWGYGSLDAKWYTQPSEHYRKVVPLIDKDTAWAGVGKSVVTGASGDAGRQRGRFYLYCRQNGLWTRTVTGFDPAKERDKITPFCPVRNITKDYPPIVMIHGTADTDVPFEESANMAFELQKHGVRHELLTVPEGGHGLGGGDRRMIEWAHERALQFIREQLR